MIVELTVKVPEELAPEMKALAEKLARMVDGCADEWLDDDDFHVFFKQAVEELNHDRVIRRPRDYGWIMAALNQGLIADIEPFVSPARFRWYLKFLKIVPLPCKTTIASAYNSVLGDFPDWEFLDGADATESMRRKNVVYRFRSAFMRAKRAKLDANLVNRP